MDSSVFNVVALWLELSKAEQTTPTQPVTKDEWLYIAARSLLTRLEKQKPQIAETCGYFDSVCEMEAMLRITKAYGGAVPDRVTIELTDGV